MRTARWFFLMALATWSCKHDYQITSLPMTSGTTHLLQAISIVNEHVTWVSGHHATFCRTLDGGLNWEVFQHPTNDSLQFRDLHAFNEHEVVLMSAGPGNLSRIYMYTATTDSWTETYQMTDSLGFLNTIEFWNSTTGLAFGDSFNGQHFVLKTIDGGLSWNRISPSVLPVPGEGEGGFAASGTCISMLPNGEAFIGTGAGGSSHILKTNDYGVSWSVSAGPLIKGPVAGITSIRILPSGIGLVVGGDLTKTDVYTDNIAFTENFGQSWQRHGFPVTLGAFYGSAILPVGSDFFASVCGPNGIDYSFDLGSSWENLSDGNYWGVAFHPSGLGYATGSDGKILKIMVTP